MKVPVEGGTPLDLAGCQGAGGATWTADNTLIFAPIYSDGLFRVSAEGGESERLTTPDRDAGELGHWWPDVVPGGRWVLFTAFRTPVDRSRIGVLDLETGEAFCRWKDSQGVVEQRVLSSRTDHVNVVELTGLAGRKLTTTLCLQETPGREGEHSGFQLDQVFTSVQSQAEPGWLTFHASYANDRGGYEGLARVTIDGGEMSVAGDQLRIVDADAILVVSRICPLADGTSSQRASVQDDLAALWTWWG